MSLLWSKDVIMYLVHMKSFYGLEDMIFWVKTESFDGSKGFSWYKAFVRLLFYWKTFVHNCCGVFTDRESNLIVHIWPW